jgi:hypothetical protein
VLVDISKPLLWCITIFSEKRQTTDLYDVKYEKLPNYCYSCGIIGHSSVECPTPANRNENGLLPYGRDLRALDDNKQKRGLEDRQSFLLTEASILGDYVIQVKAVKGNMALQKARL